MVRRTSLRASDSDREQVAEWLRVAASEGRLSSEELEQRLGAAFAARTYGELDSLVYDLPRPVPATRPPSALGPLMHAARTLVLFTLLAPFVFTLMMLVVATVFFAWHGLVAGWAVWLLAAWLVLRRGRRAGHRYYSSRSDLRYAPRRPLL